MKPWTLELGDCLEVLPKFRASSFDSVVTDPPYGLEFMGKHWDHGVPGVHFWEEVLRVMKPGAWLVAFGGARTYHRLACAIEDAGFEIRDSIDWIYGTGFPKSLDISKSLDRKRYDREEVLEVTAWLARARDEAGLTNGQIDQAFGFHGMAGHWTSNKSQPEVPTLDQVPTLLELLGVEDPPERIRSLLCDLNGAKRQPGANWWKREKIGTRTDGAGNTGEEAVPFMPPGSKTYDVSKSATEDAEKWEGWGTALKPAHEPIVLARRPLEGTVAANVQKWGTGGINVDGCRVETGDNLSGGAYAKDGSPRHDGAENWRFKREGGAGEYVQPPGRWPPNVVLDEAAAAELDRQSGELASGDFTRGETSRAEAGAHGIYGRFGGAPDGANWEANVGGASRFFPIFRYEPKAHRTERDAGLESLPKRSEGELMNRKDGAAGTKHARAGGGHGGGRNLHPTVKPLGLIQWLCRLVTPRGGVVLDPFSGSGTTGVAALREGFEFTGIELEPEYHELARVRIEEDAPLFNRR